MDGNCRSSWIAFFTTKLKTRRPNNYTFWAFPVLISTTRSFPSGKHALPPCFDRRVVVPRDKDLRTTTRWQTKQPWFGEGGIRVSVLVRPVDPSSTSVKTPDCHTLPPPPTYRRTPRLNS